MLLLLDTCVWLNLFQEERRFVDETKALLLRDYRFLVSSIVLRELEHVLVSRDKALLRLARKHVKCFLPGDLL